MVIFVGHARGGLSAPQHADVAGLAAELASRGHRRDRRRCAGRYAERRAAAAMPIARSVRC